MVPDLRISAINNQPTRPGGDYVLYWMIAARRTSWNFAIDRAREQADALGKPLVILEALRLDYRWACARFHGFVIDGMRDNAAACRRAGVLYHPYLERRIGQGRGLLAALAGRAAIVVTDEFPSFFVPRMVAAAGASLQVRLEAVDSNGLLPLRGTDRTFPTAYAFRRLLQQQLPRHLADRPRPESLAGQHRPAPTLSNEISARWPHALDWLDSGGQLDDLAIDHSIERVAPRGGEIAARARLRDFLSEDLESYGSGRNQPDRDVSSRLSAYLHWGHLSVHEAFDAITSREGWLGVLPAKATGGREGWWGLTRSAESFLDELITWREVGYNMSSKRTDHDCFDSLPSWAIATLQAHAGDARLSVYQLDAFEAAETHDPLWNAAQRQLRREGRIHNYLRMLWGKKILEWSASPQGALGVMIELNNKYALDGRNPNSYSGIFWVLGRYDRPWWPERPVYGSIRYMSSDNTAKKLRVREYLRRFAE